MTEAPKIAPDTAVDKAEREARAAIAGALESGSSLARRGFFGSSMLGALSVVLAACSNEFAGLTGGGRNRKASDKPAGGGADLSDGGGEDVPPECRDLDGAERATCIDQNGGVGGTESSGLDADGIDGTDGDSGVNSDKQDSCHANVTTKINLVGMPAAEGALIPRVVIYGRMDSAMIAMKWETATEDLGHIMLVTPSGRLLALHGITGADKDAAGKYRPIVIDNIWLKDAGADITELKIVIQMAGKSVVYSAPVTFMTTYNSKPVVDLANGGAVAGNQARWSITRFTEGPAFNVDTSYSYPSDFNGGAVRNLKTVRATSTWTPQIGASGIQGTVTDIMGDAITLTGSAIMEYHVFCTYVLESGSYYRTILHIG